MNFYIYPVPAGFQLVRDGIYLNEFILFISPVTTDSKEETEN
jgi:hypothetical protein